MPDDVPDATEGNVPGREADTAPDGPPDDDPDTAEGNVPDAVGTLTAWENAGDGTVQGVPEVEVVPQEAIVPLGQTGEDAPAAEERWAYASELIGDAFQHWGNGPDGARVNSLSGRWLDGRLINFWREIVTT